MSNATLAAIKDWTFQRALPFWAENGVDHARGGYFEELDLNGQATAVEFKRVRVICRQLYVFSHADVLGWTRGAALADAGFEFLMRGAWRGSEGGWAKRLDPYGAVSDATPDLYDQAFGLFAMAWRYRQSGDAAALACAHETLDFVERAMGEGAGRGYWNELPAGDMRAQNPHMHLFEACLAAFDASQDQRFLDRASTLAALFRDKFFDGRTLAEFFTRDWARAPGEPGRLIEPGHQCEWAWILAQHQKMAGVAHLDEMRALLSWSDAFGFDAESGVVFNSVRDDGVALDRGSRTWPNTERLKGWLAWGELTGEDVREKVAASARLLLGRYLTPEGSWLDAFDADGVSCSEAAPASTFYHVFLAFAEALRLEKLWA